MAPNSSLSISTSSRRTSSDHVVAFGARVEKKSWSLHELIIRYVNAWSVGHLLWGVIIAILTESLEADEPCFISKQFRC